MHIRPYHHIHDAPPEGVVDVLGDVEREKTQLEKEQMVDFGVGSTKNVHGKKFIGSNLTAGTGGLKCMPV